MRYYTQLIISLFVSLFAQKVGAEDNISAEQKIDHVWRRVDKGENSALLELATMPASITIPLLSNVLRNSKKGSQKYGSAREAIIQNPETTNYFRERLAEAEKRGGVDEDAFEILGKFASTDGPVLVAPYLFSRNTYKGTGDELARDTIVCAAQSLGEMGLANAPTNKHPGAYKGADILAWQKWAISKGLVPVATKTHIPQWLADLDASASHPPAVESPAAADTSTQPTPLPTTAQATRPSPTTAENPAPVVERRSAMWPWVVGSAALIAIVARLFKRRA